MKNRLLQNHASFQYQLPASLEQAELLVRRAADGYEAGRLPLQTGATYKEADLQGYPAGVYFYTLLVDGVPAVTRRLVVR